MEIKQGHYTDLQSMLQQINATKAAIDALRPLSAEQEGRAMQKLRLDWNFHSNSIEGNSLTYGETIAFLMEGLTAKGKPFKDHLDLKGHNEGIDYLMDIVKNRDQLTEMDIRTLHKIILVEPYRSPARTADGQATTKQVTLGAYKTQPDSVKTVTGEMHYYASPEETPIKMAELMDWLQIEQQKGELHPVVIAAILHHRLVAIHPFDDGNGRMSRLLMNLILMQHGYPPAVIKQQDRNDYYYALRQADAGDIEPFITFIADSVQRALDLFLRAARGESIEDAEDLDKEIALLKMGLQAEKILQTTATPDAVSMVLANSLLPLFEGIRTEGLKLADLFL